MIEHLPRLLADAPAVARRARTLRATALIEVGDRPYLLRVENGAVSVETGPFLLPSWDFALRAPAEEWRRFWLPVPPPGANDLLAMMKRRVLRLEGTVHPFMANLLFYKQLLELPRRLEARA
jgi:hypothetical protein